MKKTAKLIVTLGVLFTISAIPASANASTQEGTYWFQNVGYTSTVGKVSWYSSGAPSSYSDLGVSTAVVSSAATYNSATNTGVERGRIWSRPNNVKSYMSAGSYYTSTPSTIKAVLQYQPNNPDSSNLWITASDPVATETNKIEVPQYIYTLANVINRYGSIVGEVTSFIDGFVYSSVTVSNPGNTPHKRYIEFFNINGLSNAALDDQYTYKEADYASRGVWKGASAKWSFFLESPGYKNYPVNVVGRVMYMTYNQDQNGNGFYNYAWSGLASAPHVVNRN